MNQETKAGDVQAASREAGRRTFLRSVKSWSGVVAGLALAIADPQPGAAAGWLNHRGGGGWINGGGGGWVNRGGGWINGGGGGWVNRRGGGGWVNFR